MRQPCNSLSLNFLTVVIKLYHICDKAFRLIWKSFSTDVKKLICNGICASPYPILHLEAFYSACKNSSACLGKKHWSQKNATHEIHIR